MSVPLLCIAGTLCDGRVFEPMLAAARIEDAICVTVEHPTVELAAFEVLAEAPAQFVAIGFSLGGFVALELARRAPDRVRGLVLIGSNARADPEDKAFSRRVQLTTFVTYGAAAVVDESWPACVGAAQQSREELHATLAAMARGTPLARFAAQIELAISRPDVRSALPTLTMPLLALHGREDRLCPPERAEEMAERAPAGAGVLLDGVGHYALLENPDAVAAALNAWRARAGLD